MSVAETSIKAYTEIVAEGRAITQRDKILELIKRIGSLTREEISECTGLRLASVCGRVNELIRDGLLEERVTTRSRHTGRECKVVSVPKAEFQLCFFEGGEYEH